MPDAPVTEDRDAIAALRAALDNAGYTSAALQERLALEGPFSLDWTELPVYVRKLSGTTPFTTVTRLFLLGLETARKEAEAALAPLTIERLIELGMLSPAGEEHVVNSMAILPWSGFLIASDPLEQELPPTRSDHVLNVIPPSVTLANLTPRRQVETTLDVGVGSGVQALLAAQHSKRVVGVDVNPRALAFAELNLALNRVSNVELRLGDGFDAVEGETFDLIVSNPPYVVSPESQYAFRDSGRRGDEFCEELTRRAPEFLVDGGRAVLLVCWAHAPDEDWSNPLRRWVGNDGCDALAVRLLTQDPLAYSALWNHQLRTDPIAYDRAITRWLDYLSGLGIEQISFGGLLLRRRAGGNWFAPYESSLAGIDDAGEHLERMIAANDYLAAEDGDGLLRTRFRLADDHLLDQTLVLHDRRGSVQKVVLRLDGGFNFELDLSKDSFQLLCQIDGRPLEDVLADLAEQRDDMPREELAEKALPAIKGLFELGFLVRASGESDSR